MTALHKTILVAGLSGIKCPTRNKENIMARKYIEQPDNWFVFAGLHS